MTDDADRLGRETDAPSRGSLSDAVDPLTGVDPDADFDDLDVVEAAIGDADVVGMGEASHGTREFFRFKHRLFRYLVEQSDVRLLCLEANFAATLDVNDYVTQGEGTAEDALSQDAIHPAYRTESVLALVEWIRAFNEDRAPDDRVRFHGLDVQRPSVAASKLDGFFETVDPAVPTDVRDDLDLLAEGGLPDFSDDEAVRARLDAREAVVSTLGDALEAREDAYVAATSRREYERAGRLAWTIEQGRRQFEAVHRGRTDAGANVRIRDSAMAAQVQWLRRHESVDRAALWGHNAHLARDSFAGGRTRREQSIPSLGRNLSTLSGVDYYALGLVLGGGAVGATYVPDGEFRAYDIEEPPEGSVPDVFGRVESPAFFLDLRDVSADSALGEWLDAGPRRYDVVGGYEDSPVSLVESDYRRQFDGLVFVDETTATRPLSATRSA